MPLTSSGVASRMMSGISLSLFRHVGQDHLDPAEAARYPVIDVAGDPQQHEAEDRVQQHGAEKDRTGLRRTLAQIRDERTQQDDWRTENDIDEDQRLRGLARRDREDLFFHWLSLV